MPIVTIGENRQVCPELSDCDFRRCPRSAYKIADIWHVKYRRLNSPAFAKYASSRGFLRHCCESPVKPTHQVGRFYHMSFQNCHITAIGEKNRQVCPHQSVAKIACDFRWRSNSPRSAYKIASCVAGFTDQSIFQSINLYCLHTKSYHVAWFS